MTFLKWEKKYWWGRTQLSMWHVRHVWHVKWPFWNEKQNIGGGGRKSYFFSKLRLPVQHVTIEKKEPSLQERKICSSPAISDCLFNMSHMSHMSSSYKKGKWTCHSCHKKRRGWPLRRQTQCVRRISPLNTPVWPTDTRLNKPSPSSDSNTSSHHRNQIRKKK